MVALIIMLQVQNRNRKIKQSSLPRRITTGLLSRQGNGANAKFACWQGGVGQENELRRAAGGVPRITKDDYVVCLK